MDLQWKRENAGQIKTKESVWGGSTEGRGGAPGNSVLEPRLKDLTWNGVVPSGQDSTQLVLKLVKQKAEGSLLLMTNYRGKLCKCSSRKGPGSTSSRKQTWVVISATWSWLSFESRKDPGLKASWNLLLRLRKVDEAGPMTGQSMHEDLERPLREAGKAKPGLY